MHLENYINIQCLKQVFYLMLILTNLYRHFSPLPSFLLSFFRAVSYLYQLSDFIFDLFNHPLIECLGEVTNIHLKDTLVQPCIKLSLT